MSFKEWVKENRKLVWGGGAAATVGLLVLAATQRDAGVNTDPDDDYSASGEPKRLLSKDKVNKDPFSGQPCKPGGNVCNPSTDLPKLKAMYKAERAKIRDLKKQGASESEQIAAWNKLNFIAVRYIWERRLKRQNKSASVSGLGQFDFEDFQDIASNDRLDFIEYEYGDQYEDDNYYIEKTGDIGKELFEDEIYEISSQGTPGVDAEWFDDELMDDFGTTQFASDNGQDGFYDAPDGLMLDYDDMLMGYTLGARPSANYTAADVIRSAKALKKSKWRGKNCWEWVAEAYRRAGNTGKLHQSQYLFIGSQYRYKWRNNNNKRTKNPWVKMHNVPFLPESLYSEIKPGDWLYIFNKSVGPNGAHSIIFNGWHDEGKRIANGLGNWGANKPGANQRFDLRKHPVTFWMRPPGESAPSSLTVGRWMSQFDTSQSQFWLQSLNNFPPARPLHGYSDYDYLPQENGWMHTSPGTLAQAPLQRRRRLRLHGMNVVI